jgi:uridine phosphorylase
MPVLYDKRVIAHVDNFPSLQGVTTQDATAKYKLSDYDISSELMYFGYIASDNNWYIAQFNKTNCTMRYAKGESGYTTAWTNRATQTYGYYNTIFKEAT